jgi:hypothetical protein
MDLDALREILTQLVGEVGFERGRSYSTEITAEEVKRVFGEEPPPGAKVGLNGKIWQEADGPAPLRRQTIAKRPWR